MLKTPFIPISAANAFLGLMAVLFVSSGSVAMGQANDLAVVRGRIAFERGEKQKIPYEKFEVKLRQQVQLPPAPTPKDFADRTPEARREWFEAFEKTEQGKKLIAQRDKLIDEAEVFDVLIEKNGSFIVYDVPPGVYGIQSRLDREIDGTKYAYEVFGEISVSKKVDEVPLAPILIEITPLLEFEQTAPPVAVDTYNNSSKLQLSTFEGKYVFINFWSTANPDLKIQQQVQQMYVDLKNKYPIKLLSICIDEKRKPAIKFIVDKKLREGSHGFTDGWDHPTVDAYGVRSIPSFWLIHPNRKIIMTQYNFGQAFNAGSRDLAQIVANRIEGKDKPNPAKKD